MVLAIRSIGLVILLLSLLPIGLGRYFYNKSISFYKTAVQTQGIVFEIQEKKKSGDSSFLYYPVFSYEDEDGNPYNFRASLGQSPAGYSVGDPVTLYYDPANPEKAKKKNMFAIWALPGLFWFVGMCSFLFGLFILVVVPLFVSEKANHVKGPESPISASFVPSPALVKEGNEKLWATFSHLTALCAYLGVPFGHIVGPLIIWLIKKDEMPFVDDQGKESLNFQISMTFYGIVAFLLCFVFIGFAIIPILMMTNLVLVIVASVKANNGEKYRYPLTIRLIQ